MLIRRRRNLIVDDHQVEPVDGGWVTSMRVGRPGEPSQRLILRLHDRATTHDGAIPIDTTATPFLPIVTTLAGLQGLRLSIDGSVDPVAFEGAQRAAELMAEWFLWRRPSMSASHRTPPVSPTRGAALFFSRGLDSTHSLFCGAHAIDQLIAIDWEDPPLASDGTRAIMRGTTAAADDLGMPMHRVSSNARHFSDPLLGWDDAVGPTLASFALLLAPLAGTVVVSATLPQNLMRPKGTHPELDPLWSSSRTRIEHVGAALGRSEKAAAVAGQPFLQRWLKVCWQREGDGNCGTCAKCLMTMSNFAAIGRLDSVSARFDAPLTPAAVRALGAAPVALENLIDVVERTPPGELHDAWSELLEKTRQP